MMNKNLLPLIMLITLSSCVSGQSKVPQTMPRMLVEPSGIDPQKMEDAEYKYTLELGVYADAVYDRIVNYLETLGSKPLDLPAEMFVGYWRLQDEKGVARDSRGYFDSKWEFDIEVRNGFLYLFLSALPSCRLFFNDENLIYYVTRYGVLKKLRLQGDKLYVYILNKDLWHLDAIHEGGKYYYAKHPVRDLVRP